MNLTGNKANTTPLLPVGSIVHLSSHNIFDSSVLRRNDFNVNDSTQIVWAKRLRHVGETTSMQANRLLGETPPDMQDDNNKFRSFCI